MKTNTTYHIKLSLQQASWLRSYTEKAGVGAVVGTFSRPSLDIPADDIGTLLETMEAAPEAHRCMQSFRGAMRKVISLANERR